jgi:chromosome segregation ATPase
MPTLEVIGDRVLDLCRRFGKPVKAAACFTVEALVPGGGLLAKGLEAVLDCAHESAKNKWEFDQRQAEALTTQAGLERIEQALGLLDADLRTLLGQVAQVVDQPDRARGVIAVALEEEKDRYRDAQKRLGELAEGFARMEKKIDDVRNGQSELLREVRKVKKRVTRLGKKDASLVRRDEDQRGPSIYDPF